MPDADRALLNKTIPVHRAWAKKLLDAGVLVQAGKWGDGGMIIVKAEIGKKPTGWWTRTRSSRPVS